MSQNSLISSITKKNMLPFIRYSDFNEIHVIPYIRGRLVFSELVARALEKIDFEFIAIDLPQFMNDEKYHKNALKMFPRITSLYLQKDQKTYLSFTISPNDAAILASFLAMKKNISSSCLDNSNIHSFPTGVLLEPSLNCRDDYFVFSEGLEKYFKSPWDQLKTYWLGARDIQKVFTIYRASEVAERLGLYISSGLKTLLVCEYHLWWFIKGILEGKFKDVEKISYAPEEGILNAAYVIGNPGFIWAQGLLDDFPILTHDLFCKVLQDKVGSFDKIDILNNILMDTVCHKNNLDNGNGSIGELIIFKRYLKNLMTTYRRITPLPVKHLIKSLEACFGKELTKKLVKRLLSYPLPRLETKLPNPIFLSISSKTISGGGKPFDIPDISRSIPYHNKASCSSNSNEINKINRLYWLDKVQNYLTREEIKKMPAARVTKSWAVREDYEFHEQLCAFVRSIARDNLTKIRVCKSWGNLEDRIDWKSTLNAYSRGEDCFYVKKIRRNRMGRLTLNEFTPMVFIFFPCDNNNIRAVHDSNITQRIIDLGEITFPIRNCHPPDLVFSPAYIISKSKIFLNGHFRKDKVSAIAFLHTKSVMGVDRYDAITKRPEKFQCREEPKGDPELSSFYGVEKLIGWAVKYSEGDVIVIHYEGYRLPNNLKVFSNENNVKILMFPLSIISPELIKRIQKLHFMSAALKKHVDQEKIIGRVLN
ncbi:hypothetical protein AYK24_02715 [Thermoplasmatales archaeon SG8-52-4]|nr:MAG: hypothetical protein AYK24_02715 [Thermoplasmatales archaeon SG8-52-4]